ncbi:hypothetical protein C7M61_002116 [Candidozyma pseudohaemuli]|uniref:Uncharacterized protein n=1 Tax=Candidozyma pseudohaemuli TaxID=418784 RepID=A0A2P7YU65_9ASCO|nr:hypothetical protein C7M61_002116 [[Candida] pseudohaemulonii]PSK39501.1 hypothetical protein C7M61_002116 [[Candida] pseudohaemulonii]
MVTANMTYDTLCFIEKNEWPKSLSRAIADEVEKNSSNYVSHETHTFTIQGNVWTASELQLNKARSISLKAHSMDRAKIAEGVLRFGQFPNLKDGRGRIVFLFIQLHQLLVVPKKWVECWGYRASVGVRCLQVGDIKIPLGVGLSHEEPEEWYDAIDSQEEIKIYGVSKVGKVQDVVLIDQFPKDTMIVQNVSEHVLEEVSKIDNCLGHQTCILCQRDNVVMITTIYSSSPANSSKLSISQNTQKIDDNEADEKPDDFALVASNGFWKLKSTCGFSFDREVSFPLSKSFHVFDEEKFANNYESSSGNYYIRALQDQPLLASPKLYFGRILKFSIDAPHTHSSFQNLVVQIAKQTIHLTPQALKQKRTDPLLFINYPVKSTYTSAR